jgi:RTX calcium-binding nonapeptide repeat (4 copies)
MIPSISIEAHPAGFLGIPPGTVHLYLVYRGDLGDEYVIRSGPRHPEQLFGGEMKIEANVPIAHSADARDGDSLADRHSTVLDFPDVDQAWAIMVKYARMLDDVDYGYNVLRENSNAFCGAMLDAAGGTPTDMLPTGIDSAEAVGFTSWPNIVADVPPPPNGTIYGTAAADTLSGIQIADVIVAGAGNDSVRAGRGDDVVFGGAGGDRIGGQAGADRLHGQGGNDALWGAAGDDFLWGGGGRDRLHGGGGNDRLIGGPGPDVFEFRDHDGYDRVLDFTPGSDHLRIRSAAVDDFGDLALSRTGPAGENTRIAFDGSVIVLRHVDLDHFGPDDVQIVAPDDLMT